MTWPSNSSYVLFITLFSDLPQGRESYEVASEDQCVWGFSICREIENEGKTTLCGNKYFLSA